MNPLAPRAATAALLAAAILPAGVAEAKRPAKGLRQATYEVVVRAHMTEEWYFDELSSIPCDGGACTRETKGEGKATAELKARPVQWMVMRGFGGRPPMLNVGTGEGAPLTGPVRRTGDLVTHYEGSWAAGNPDVVPPTSDCGTRSISVDFNLFFTKRNVLAPSAAADTERENCPDGPPTGLEWDDDQAPSLSDVITQTSQTRFLRTKDFTVRGSRTWKASVQPPTGAYVRRAGSKTTTWRWEATFRMKRRGV